MCESQCRLDSCGNARLCADLLRNINVTCDDFNEAVEFLVRCSDISSVKLSQSVYSSRLCELRRERLESCEAHVSLVGLLIQVKHLNGLPDCKCVLCWMCEMWTVPHVIFLARFLPFLEGLTCMPSHSPDGSVQTHPSDSSTNCLL